MEDLGKPSSYLALEPGARVFTCDGEEVGKVEHVLRDEDADIFDGIVIDTSVLPGGHRFAEGDQVEEIFERGVLLKPDKAGAEALPEPGPNPAVVEADPAEEDESDLQRKLRRAWDLISGNY